MNDIMSGFVGLVIGIYCTVMVFGYNCSSNHFTHAEVVKANHATYVANAEGKAVTTWNEVCK